MTLSNLIASALLAVQPYEMLTIRAAGGEAIVGRLSLPAVGFKKRPGGRRHRLRS